MFAQIRVIQHFMDEIQSQKIFACDVWHLNIENFVQSIQIYFVKNQMLKQCFQRSNLAKRKINRKNEQKLMFQDLIINCPNQEHDNNVKLICFDKSCKTNRLYCMQCNREGMHCSHPQYQYELPILLEHIEKAYQECDHFVNRIKQIIDLVYQSFNQLIGGIREKFQRSKEQFLNLNSKQMNSFFEQVILFKSFEAKIETQITESSQNFQYQLKYLYQDLNISQLNYCQISNSDIQKSQEICQKGYELWLNDNDYLEAIKNFDQALIWNPKNQSALQKKAYCLRLLKQYKEAIQWADKALDIDPKHEDTMKGKGISLFMLEEYKEAIIWIDKALEINPNNKLSLYYKADCLRLLKQYKEAIIQADKALEIDPQYQLALYCKGQCLQTLNQYAEALIFYEKYLKIDPNDQYAKIRKNQCLEALEIK
ncbi:unnamed protein product [Paramecium sonneborni]|uniref:Tetratricopeptide repeat protein n=1 Tax=Paramecium sonneborni TaxID=65129 RepID=A0A8S1RTQ4_9CILI|nr:unnamed protein product [Paramecium sonneborni]